MLSLSRCLVDGRGRGGLAWPLPLFVALLSLSGLGALLIPAGGASAAPVAGQDLTIFAGPGAEYGEISYAPAGSAIGVDGAAVDGFVPVSVNGVSGWVAEWAVAFDGAPTEGVVEGSFAAEPVSEAAVYEEGGGTEPAASPSEMGSGATGDEAIIEIIYAAADRYGQPREDMLRVARCESVLDPNAINGPGNTHGLFQFLPETFASTPYAGSSIYDPYANANAAGWMWSEGRRNEWVCQ